MLLGFSILEAKTVPVNVPEPNQLAAWREIQDAEAQALTSLRSRLALAEVDPGLDPLGPLFPPCQATQKP